MSGGGVQIPDGLLCIDRIVVVRHTRNVPAVVRFHLDALDSLTT